jgi:hypothetical protein
MEVRQYDSVEVRQYDSVEVRQYYSVSILPRLSEEQAQTSSALLRLVPGRTDIFKTRRFHRRGAR